MAARDTVGGLRVVYQPRDHQGRPAMRAIRIPVVAERHWFIIPVVVAFVLATIASFNYLRRPVVEITTRTLLSLAMAAVTCFKARAMSGVMAFSDCGRLRVMRQIPALHSTRTVSLGDVIMGPCLLPWPGGRGGIGCAGC